MRAIWQIAREHGLYVIEDAAHAAGSEYEGRKIGAGTSGQGSPASDAVAFSFYATKNMTTGEGGMVTSPIESVAAKMRILSLHGMSRDAWNRYSEKGSWYYEVTEPGFKYNLSDIQSALGIHQLRKLDSFIERREYLVRLYKQCLGDCAEVELPTGRADSRHSWHLYILRLRLDLLSIDRAAFIDELRSRGVGTSVHFIPIPLHPYFASVGLDSRSCPRAMEMYSRILSLPLYPAMTEDQVIRVAEAVKDIAAAHRKTRQVCLSEVG
jgi:dTDP-4-amino-4,6-dideoxygalactose transaminase